MIGAGELDRRITILRPGAPVDDGYQTLPGAPETVATVWAAYRPISDGERSRGNLESVRVDARFTIRWRADVTHDCAVLFDGLHFQVVRLKEIGRRQWLEITAAVETS